MNKLHLLKILLFMFQVVSQFPNSLYLSFPTYSTVLLKIFGFLSLSSIHLIPFHCSTLLTDLNVNYHHIMIIATMFPIVFSVFLFFLLCIVNEMFFLHDDDESRHFFGGSEDGHVSSDDDGSEDEYEDEEGSEADVISIDDIHFSQDEINSKKFRRMQKKEQKALIRKEEKENQVFNYFYKVVTSMYFFYDLWIGNITQLLAGSFFCVQLNDNDPNLSDSSYRVLW